MKFLVDANLSPKLCLLLADLFPESVHVDSVGLAQTDQGIWKHARDNSFLILTKDDDFRYLAELFGPPPKVIWVRLGNCQTSRVHILVRTEHQRIVEFSDDPSEALLVLP